MPKICDSLLSRFNLPILLIDLDQRIHSITVIHIRVQDHAHHQGGRLRRTSVVADAVMAARSFIPGASRLDHLHRVVVHFVEHRAAEDIGRDRGAAMPVGRGRCVGGEFHP